MGRQLGSISKINSMHHTRSQHWAYKWPVQASKRAIVFVSWQRRAVSQWPRDRSFRTGERAILWTSGIVMALPQSWLVCVSQTQTSPSSWKRHAKSFPPGEYACGYLPSKVERMKLGSVVIPWIAWGGTGEDDGQAIRCQEDVLPCVLPCVLVNA